jgi:hypothetical protein
VSDLFLGLIAFAVLVMASIQVAVIVVAARAARRVGRLADRLEEDLKPVVSSLQAVATEAARAASAAASQVERVDLLTKDLAARVEQTAAAVQAGVLAPLREGFAVVEGLRAVLSSLRDLRSSRSRHRGPVAADEEDALFIG